MKRKSVVVPKTIDVYSLGLCAFFSISLFSLSSLICLRKIFQQHRWISYMWMWEAKNWISTVQFWQDFILFAEQQKKMKKKSNKMLEEGKSLNKKKIWWQYFGKRDKRSNDKRDRILRFWYIECVYAFEWSTLSARCDNTSLHGIFFASLQIIPNRKPVVDGYVTVSWYYSHQYFRKIQVLFELPLHKQRIWMFSFVRHCILFSEWVRFFQLRFPAVKYMHFDDFESWAATALMKPRIDKFADWFPI